TTQYGSFMVAFTPDSKTLATVGHRDVRFWRVADGQEYARTKGVDLFTNAIAFSPNGKILATTEMYESGVVHLWDVATGSLKSESAAQTTRPDALAFSPDSER